MESLGIDLRLMIAQIINFAVLLFILNKVLYKPLTKLLNERSKKIDESLKNSEKIEERLINLEKKEKDILQKAHLKAKSERIALIDLANLEKEKIISDAKDASEKEVQKGIERLRAYEKEAEASLRSNFMNEMLDKLTVKLSKESTSKKYPVLKKVLGDK
jgi:F-type H+-transporting ATPase subunit b